MNTVGMNTVGMNTVGMNTVGETKGRARISIVTGLCVSRDAISASVMYQRQVLLDAGYEVRVFAHNSDLLEGDDLSEVRDPWILQRDPYYATSDLVIFHHGIFYGLFNALLVKHARARTVVHFHNITPPGLLSASDAPNAVRSIEQISIASMADSFWVDSTYNADCLLEWADVDPENIYPMALCVGWILEGELIAPSAGQVSTPETRIIAVGRMVQAKGLTDLVRAVAALPPSLRSGVRLQLVGGQTHSDIKYIDELRGLITSFDLIEQVELIFDPEDGELQDLYAAASIFVSPSHHEGFCVPVIEALTHCCRVIVTDAGALPDTAGPCGVVVPVGDVTALAGAIQVAATSGEQTPQELSQAEKHLRQFSIQAFQQRLLLAVEAELALNKPTLTGTTQ
ncbi:MAG: glycosyltransferase [Actinobacteria bacterium]|nr:glycosyltransferase [Actinomycetota bacterium]